jgi:hypothetical protein
MKVIKASHKPHHKCTIDARTGRVLHECECYPEIRCFKIVLSYEMLYGATFCKIAKEI